MKLGMTNEDAIKWLENLKNDIGNPHYERLWDYAQAIDEICYLLKEQEAVEPKVEKAILDYQSWHYICGDCGGQIDINDNYCRHCGRVVAHFSNKI